jgi:hypothetical protein
MASLVKCTPGNKPCGERCIPSEYTCRDGKQEDVDFQKDYKLRRVVAITSLIGASVVVGTFAGLSATNSYKSKSSDFTSTEQANYAQAAKVWALASVAGTGLFMGMGIASRMNNSIVNSRLRKKILKSKPGKNIAKVLKGTKVEEGFDQMLEESKTLEHGEAIAMKMDSYHDDNVGGYLAALARERLGAKYNVAYYPSGERKGLYVYKRDSALTALQFLTLPIPLGDYLPDLNKSALPEEAQIIF